MAAAASLALSSSPFTVGIVRGPELWKRQPQSIICASKPFNLSQLVESSPSLRGQRSRIQPIVCSVSVSSSEPEVLTGRPDELVSSILSKVVQSDRGVALTEQEHKEVAQLAQELNKFCVSEPVKCPLIFGDWNVAYSSNPTSPGGGYRSAFGRLVFKTKEMIQAVEAPDVIRNKVSFSALGFLDGEVSLKGKLTPLDERWIQVTFEPPQLTVGAFDFQYGGESEVKLQITYIDERIRLGKGSRGTLFVFTRRS